MNELCLFLHDNAGINGNHDGQRNKRYQTPTASFPPSIPSMLPGRQQIGEERGAVCGAAGGVAPTGASSLGDTSVKSAFRRGLYLFKFLICKVSSLLYFLYLVFSLLILYDKGRFLPCQTTWYKTCIYQSCALSTFT